jgi:flavin reductase (DIM6/NTAB) family NADH-FMN oxidoreductase RutF
MERSIFYESINCMNQHFQTILPGSLPTKDWHQLMLGCIAPRPIAWVSTVDEQGRSNLAPYSFFNAFSSNPPILVFSSNRRVANNTTKDTLHNVMTTKEAVINVVNFQLVRKMALTSVEFEAGVSEFEKAGLTPLASEVVKPFRVAESPAQFECKVKEIIALGDQGGAGHLVICDVLRLHIDHSVMDGDRINPHKMDLMGRMGRAYYVRAHGDAIHTLYQSLDPEIIGYDQLPQKIKSSKVLSANAITRLAALKTWPNSESDLSIEQQEIWISYKERKNKNSAEELAMEILEKGDSYTMVAALLLNEIL